MGPGISLIFPNFAEFACWDMQSSIATVFLYNGDRNQMSQSHQMNRFVIYLFSRQLREPHVSFELTLRLL